MCSGAMRAYLLELDALPDTTLVSMVPVGLKAKESHLASVHGGNALGSVMVKLGTDLDDPADRLRLVHESMVDGKRGLAEMTPMQILAMSALGQAPAILAPMLRMGGVVKPPYNLIISNVPGPRTTQYFNGMRLVGTYPLSIPIDGMALNITCNSYDDQMAFGLTGCRRTRAPPAAPADPPRHRARRPGEGRRRLSRGRASGGWPERPLERGGAASSSASRRRWSPVDRDPVEAPVDEEGVDPFGVALRPRRPGRRSGRRGPRRRRARRSPGRPGTRSGRAARAAPSRCPWRWPASRRRARRSAVGGPRDRAPHSASSRIAGPQPAAVVGQLVDLRGRGRREGASSDDAVAPRGRAGARPGCWCRCRGRWSTRSV